MTMKSFTEYVVFNTKKHRELIRMTDQVQYFLEKIKLQEGFILVSAMHIKLAFSLMTMNPDFMKILKRG